MNSGNIYSFGYAILLSGNLLFLAATHFLLEKTETNKKFQDMMMFTGIYAFIFMISAFGIVWYGILIYYSFFVLIGLSVSTFTTYDETDEKNEDHMGIILTLS